MQTKIHFEQFANHIDSKIYNFIAPLSIKLNDLGKCKDDNDKSFVDLQKQISENHGIFLTAMDLSSDSRSLRLKLTDEFQYMLRNSEAKQTHMFGKWEIKALKNLETVKTM